jgi:tetratricopeptide (TPR) repeat protein
MDHPNIAKVFDAGATESGRPYFVMELVRGIPITEFCDQRHLTPRDRLRLFISVCQAIQHAHQKGIIHRDVKPTNVLVTMHDGAPVAKVIDFGVAKALSQQLTERTIYTQFAQMIGTPLYMSPEQAEMSGLDIDTRSDIYSLGVLLYELLTGTTPFDRQRLSRAAADEIRRIIREEDPPKPSTRLSQLGRSGEPSRNGSRCGSRDTGLDSIAAQRGIEPTKLAKLIRGELDWIVMKCLEKDRTRRYETASSLAADIERHLNDEPVLASPPSGWYRLRKFARRNKAALLTLALVAMLLVLGTGVSTWQAIRAIDAEKLAHTRWEAETRARREADAARANAIAAQKEAEQQRDRALKAEDQALANLKKAREAVDQMLNRVAGERLDNVPLMEPIRKALVEDAVRFYQGFLQQQSDDPWLRMEMAIAWRKFGIIHQHLSESAKAKPAFQESIEWLQRLVHEFPDEAAYQRELALSYQSLARMLTYQGGSDEEAENAAQRGLALFQELAEQFPDQAWDRSNLSRCHLYSAILAERRGEIKEAENIHRRNIALLEKLSTEAPEYRYQLSNAFWILGQLLVRQERPSEAEQLYRRAIDIHEQLNLKEPTSEWFRHDLAAARASLAGVLWQTRRGQEAEDLYRRAVAGMQQLAADFPATPMHAIDEASIQAEFANMLQTAGRVDEAVPAAQRAAELLEKIVAQFPQGLQYRLRHSDYVKRLADVLAQAGRVHEAEQAYHRAIALQEKIVAERSTDGAHQRELAGARHALARLLVKLGRSTDADQQLDSAIAAYQQTVRLEPDHGNYEALAHALSEDGSLDEAVKAYREAVRLDRNCAVARIGLASTLQENGKVEEAIAVLEELTDLKPEDASAYNSLAWLLATSPDSKFRDAGRARELAKKAVSLSPNNGDYWNTLGVAYYGTGEWQKAIEAFNKSMGLRDGGNSFDWFFVAMAEWQSGNREAAREWYAKAVDRMEKNQLGDNELIRFRDEATVLLEQAEDDLEQKLSK